MLISLFFTILTFLPNISGPTYSSSANFIRFNSVGEIVYMGPINLNKDHLINRAGIEVDVIPVMRSPCASPRLNRKKKTRRARSEIGFHIREKNGEDRGSLPDLEKSKNINIKGSILGTIMHLKPERFLSRSLETGSTDSLVSSILESEGLAVHSVGSTESLSRGAITNAVVNWLHRSSPFGSIENFEQNSCSASVLDTMDTSVSVFDDEESVDSSVLCSDNIHVESGHSTKVDGSIPSIFISDEQKSSGSEVNLKLQTSVDRSNKEQRVRRQPCSIEQTPLGK